MSEATATVENTEVVAAEQITIRCVQILDSKTKTTKYKVLKPAGSRVAKFMNATWPLSKVIDETTGEIESGTVQIENATIYDVYGIKPELEAESVCHAEIVQSEGFQRPELTKSKIKKMKADAILELARNLGIKVEDGATAASIRPLVIHLYGFDQEESESAGE